MRKVTYGPSRVWRFDAHISGEPTVIDLPLSAVCISAAIDDRTTPEHLSLWFIVPVDDLGRACSPKPRTFEVYPTGLNIPAKREHVATVHDGGAFVWHVFEASDEAARLVDGLERMRERVMPK